VINVSNMKCNITVTRTNHCHFYYFSSYNRELILVMCRKSVLIDTFVLDEIIRIIVEMAISP
jgi:hypothetical protein